MPAQPSSIPIKFVFSCTPCLSVRFIVYYGSVGYSSTKVGLILYNVHNEKFSGRRCVFLSDESSISCERLCCARETEQTRAPGPRHSSDQMKQCAVLCGGAGSFIIM